jgi:hypothetical protein
VIFPIKTKKIHVFFKKNEKADFFRLLTAHTLRAICGDIGAGLGIVAGVLCAAVP